MKHKAEETRDLLMITKFIRPAKFFSSLKNRHSQYTSKHLVHLIHIRRRVVVMMSALFHIENLGYVTKMVQQVNFNELDKVSTMIIDV